MYLQTVCTPSGLYTVVLQYCACTLLLQTLQVFTAAQIRIKHSFMGEHEAADMNLVLSEGGAKIVTANCKGNTLY